jgi:hypothetical protein
MNDDGREGERFAKGATIGLGLSAIVWAMIIVTIWWYIG